MRYSILELWKDAQKAEQEPKTEHELEVDDSGHSHEVSSQSSGITRFSLV